MSRFVRMQEEVDAFRWTGEADQTEEPDWIGHDLLAGNVTFENLGTPDVALCIYTPKGTLRAERGDWIVCSPTHGVFPLSPEVFEQSYSARSDAPAHGR
jgi:hypothetical protein